MECRTWSNLDAPHASHNVPCAATWLESNFSVSRVSPVPLLLVDRQSRRRARVMSILPDEIWSRILEIGTETSRLGYRDLCCLAISCRRLRRLSHDHALWTTLLAIDFPQVNPSSLPQTPSKSLYKTRYDPSLVFPYLC